MGGRAAAALVTVALLALVAWVAPVRTPVGPQVAGATGGVAAAFEPAAAPCRLADTRDGRGIEAVAADRVRVRVAGVCGVPSDAVAAALTVTVTRPEGAGFLTLWPAGGAMPTASTVNFTAGQDRANGALLTLGEGGAIDIHGSVPTDIVVDVNGWFRPATTATAGRLVPLPPQRVYDSRHAGDGQPLAAGETVVVPLPPGVPPDATALAVNLTTTGPNRPGYFTVHPAGTSRPEASVLNTDAPDQSRAAGAVVPVSPDGLSVFSFAGGHVIVDVTGWFTGPSAPSSTDGLFVPAPTPQRLVDTRQGDPLWAGGAVDVAVPVTGASTAAVNVTLVDSMAWGYLTGYAARTPVPGTSTVNVDARGQTAANFAVVPVSGAGLGVASYGGADLVVDLAGWFLGPPVVATEGAPVNRRPPVCTTDWGPGGLSRFFAGGDPLLGADYQRSFRLPDGRVLWFFQDVIVRSRNRGVFAHNAGLVQTGACFEVLHSGNHAAPAELLFPWAHERYRRWFWPLGGDMGDDGHFHLLVAEMRERGSSYLDTVEPVATWRVTIDVSTLQVIASAPAADPSAALYGWSVTSDASYTYLYAHCYRQFGWDLLPFTDPPLLAHDWDCSSNVTVARIPRGDFDAAPRYWNGAGWVADRAQAVPVIPREGRAVNPSQVVFDGRRFVAVTKEGDWWGSTIYVDTAPAAQGPWTTYATVPVGTRCAICNTYFASPLPYRHTDGRMIVGLSNNTFEGIFTGFYAPTFFTVPTP